MFKSKYNFSFIPVALFLCINFTDAQFQSLSFFNSSDCSSKEPIQNFVFFRNGSLSLNESNEKVEAVKLSGLWQIDFCPSSNDTCESKIIYSGNSESLCTSELPTTSEVTTIQVTRFGTASMREASDFYAYEDNDFQGALHQLTNESDVNIAVKSYWFSGADKSWMIYTASNYTGNVTCLGPSQSIKSSGMGFSYSLGGNAFTIQSIKQVTECPSESSSCHLVSSFKFLISCIFLVSSIKSYLQ